MQFVELTQNYLYRIIGLVNRKQQSSYYMMRLTAQQIFPLLKIQLFNCPKYNFSLKVLGLTHLHKNTIFSVFKFFNVLLPRAIFMALGRCQRCSKSNVYSFSSALPQYFNCMFLQCTMYCWYQILSSIKW